MKSRKQLYLESLRSPQDVMMSLASGVAGDTNVRFEMGWLDRVIKRSEQESPYSPQAAVGRTAARVAQAVAPTVARANPAYNLYKIYKGVKDRIYKRKSDGKFTASMREKRMLMSQPVKMGIGEDIGNILTLGGVTRAHRARSMVIGETEKHRRENPNATSAEKAEFHRQKAKEYFDKSRSGVGGVVHAVTGIGALTPQTAIHDNMFEAHSHLARHYERDAKGQFASHDVSLGLGDAVRALTDHYWRSSGNRFRSDEGDPPLSGKNKIAVKDVIAHHKAKEAEHAAKLKTYSVKDPLPGTRKYAKKHKAERDRHAAVRTHYEALQRAGKTHVSQRQYDRDSSGRFA